MKRLVLGLLALSTLGLQMDLDRAWSDSDIDFGYVLVTLYNDGDKTIPKDYVTVQCTAFTEDDKKINTNDRSNDHDLTSGDEITLKISIELHGMEMARATCEARSR